MVLIIALLAANPVVQTIRIEHLQAMKPPIVRLTTDHGEKVCTAGPHARLYVMALEACRPKDARFSVVELRSTDLLLTAVTESSAGVRVACAVRPASLALRNEAAECAASP
jgi:hypothetical protein